MSTIKLLEQERLWQKEALSNSLKKRSIVVAHRRSGKTELACSWLILNALSITRSHPIPEFLYIHPSKKEARNIIWERLKYFVRQIPNTKVDNSTMKIVLPNGSIIRVEGAKTVGRGNGLQGLVLDESAWIDSNTYKFILYPMLTDRKLFGDEEGKILFIGTPCGKNNLFYETYEQAINNKNWYVGYFPANKSGIFDDETLEDIKYNIGDIPFNQEYMLDWDIDNANIFIPLNLYWNAIDKPINKMNQSPLVFGFDAARFGDDRSCLVGRKGTDLLFIDTWSKKDLMESCNIIINRINQYKPQVTFIDEVGLGAGIVDRLKELKYKIIGVNSGRAADKKEIYANKKAEMWSELKDWLESASLNLVASDNLRNDLTSTQYSFDNSGRLVIESKQSLKSRGQLSSDIADAIALTFYQKVGISNINYKSYDIPKQQFNNRLR